MPNQFVPGHGGGHWFCRCAVFHFSALQLFAAVIFLFSQSAWAQAVVPAELLLAEGDILPDGVVAALYNPAVNGVGDVATLAISSISGKYIYREGDGFQDVSPLGIDSVTSVQIGYADDGTVFWLPLSSGYDKWFRDTTEILNPNDDIPGTAYEINDIRRPAVTPDGQAFVWASAGALSYYYILRASPPDYVPEVFLGENDKTSHGTISDVRPFFDVSADGGNVILIIEVDEDLSPVRRVVIGDVEVVAEGDAVGGSTWADFDKLEVIDSGESLIAGHDAGGAEHLAYASGSMVVNVLSEGDIVDGVTLSGAPSLIGLNESGEAAFIWGGTDAADHLFASCDPSAGLAANGMLLLSEGDEIDVDHDSVADHTVTSLDFGLETRLALDGAGRVAVKATLDGSQAAVIRVNTTCQVGTIIVEKATIPENGGLPEPEDFRFDDCTGGSFFLLNGEQQTLQYVDAGACDVTEWAEPGWALTGLSCDDGNSTVDLDTRTATVNLEPGETVTCIFTNTQLASLTVQKAVSADGPMNNTFGFTSATLPDAMFSINNVTSSSPVWTTYYGLSPGSYDVAEDEAAALSDGWRLVGSSCSDGSPIENVMLEAAENVTCTFTNAPLGSVTIVVETTNGDGTFDFSGTAPFDGLELTTSGGMASQDFPFQLDPFNNPFFIQAADPQPDGGTLIGLGCVENGTEDSTTDLGNRSATLNAQFNEQITCTFTYRLPGTIIVEKQTTPDGSDKMFTFSGEASGTIGDGQQITVTGLEPGVYMSTELPTEGWAIEAIDCDDSDSNGNEETGEATFNVAAGETVTCTYFNILESLVPFLKNGFEANGN